MADTAKRRILMAALVLAVLLLTGAVFPMTFYLNDDVMIRSILSGGYTGVPDGHAVYMKYPLTGLISLLYRMTDRVPWFSLVMTGCFWLAAGMVMDSMVRVLSDKGQSRAAASALTALAALLCAALFLPHFIYLHYTVIAAMLGGCGLFLTALCDDKRALPLFVLCYCIRSQVFFLLLPFLGVVILWKLAEKRTQEEKPEARGAAKRVLLQRMRARAAMPAALAVCILVCMLWNGWAYRGEEWKEYTEYNNSRTQLYDYEALLPYEQYEEAYTEAGISGDQYRIMEEYNIALDETVDSAVLGNSAEISAEVTGRDRDQHQYVRQCMIDYYYHIRYADKPYNYMLLAGYFAAVVLMLWQKRWLQLLLTGCMGAGRSLIWLYLIWKGRFPERIYVSLYLLEIMTLAGLCFAIAVQKPKTGAFAGRRSAAVPGCVLLTGLLAAVLISQMGVMSKRVAGQLQNQEKWDALTAYCGEHDEKLYILDVRSMVSYAGRVWEASVQENYLLAGGWMSGNPLMKERFSAYGAADGGALLAAGGQEDSVLFVASCERDISWFSGYLSRRFEELTLEWVDSIEVQGQEIFRVYRFIP